MRRDIESLDIDAIHIGERMRPVADDFRVAALASSIKDIGLQTPISVRFVDSVTIDGEEVSHVPVLIAGRNRLEAARQLGWERIDCFILAADDIEAQLWEIAENLHRVGLTKEERDVHIRRYAELLTERETARAQQHPQTAVPVKPHGHAQPKGITRQIAEATGLSDDTIRRALADKEDRERRAREAADRHGEAKETAERAKIEACDLLLDRLPLRDWTRLIELVEAAGGSLRAADLRKWQAPSSEAA